MIPRLLITDESKPIYFRECVFTQEYRHLFMKRALLRILCLFFPVAFPNQDDTDHPSPTNEAPPDNDYLSINHSDSQSQDSTSTKQLVLPFETAFWNALNYSFVRSAGEIEGIYHVLNRVDVRFYFNIK